MGDPAAARPPKPRKRDAALLPVASRRVLGMRVDVTSYAETAEAVAVLAEAGRGGAVFAAAVNNAVHGLDDPEFLRIMNGADRVTPDGVPLVWALRLLGARTARRVYGPSLTPMICALAAEREIPVGFYGGHPHVLDELVARLCARFPGLRVACAVSPPFRALDEAEDRDLTATLEASGARILFVGLGCPKQERWIAEHRDRLPCVLVGVGAAIDFLAGRVKQAPPWMQRLGLEWLYRLSQEPRRLWRRYLVGNPRFALHLAKQLLLARRRR